VMIVDLLRNDLRRVCKVNTVKVTELCSVETYPTVLQMVSTIKGNLRPGITYSEIFKALFPCGSITGAPKVRTMRIIRDLESHSRGVYTGCIGFISPVDDEAVFNVAIRTIVLSGVRGEMGIGGGIVWDSKAEEEFEECRLKGSFLNRSSERFELIETMLWHAQRGYVFLEGHLERLLSSAEYFDFPCQEVEVRERLGKAREQFNQGESQRVRLLLSRDGGITITSTSMPQIVHNGTTNHGIKVILSSERTNANDLFLRHKTTRRTMYDREFKLALSKQYDDAIFLNMDGHVTEGAIHNLFIVKDGQWITPPVTDGLLPGVLRAELLKSKCMQEQSLILDDLLAADEVYLGNSVRGLRNVERIDTVKDLKLMAIWEAGCEKG